MNADEIAIAKRKALSDSLAHAKVQADEALRVYKQTRTESNLLDAMRRNKQVVEYTALLAALESGTTPEARLSKVLAYLESWRADLLRRQKHPSVQPAELLFIGKQLKIIDALVELGVAP